MHECHICKTKGNFKTSMIEGVLHAFCPNCKVWVEAKITWPIRTKMYAQVWELSGNVPKVAVYSK
jgi:hypothetical protein